MFSSKDLFFTPASTGYTVSKSLRFRKSATAYLSRTPSGVGTSRRIFTVSFWVKRGEFSTRQAVFSAGAVSTTPSGSMYFNTTNVFEIIGSGGAQYQLTTTQLFRDPSAWYHIVVAFDTTQATSSNRIKLYVNGSQVTAFSIATYPSLNFDTDYGNSVLTTIGSRTDDGTPPVATLDGYLAEFNYIDGAAKTPSDFGAYDTNGIWQPAAYTGSYGTNGFYLKFTDVGTTTAGGANTGYGKDFAGTNNWTTNNFGTTSTLTTYDSMLDSPTNAAGDIGNYCVLNPLDIGPTSALAAANLNFTTSSTTNYSICRGTLGVSSGKWYWEITINSSATANMVGIANATASLSEYVGQNANGWGYYSNGNKYNSGTGTAYGNSFTTTDVIGVALDLDNGALYFGKQTGGTGSMVWQNSGDPTSGASKTGAAFTTGLTGNLFPVVSDGSSASTADLIANFGQRPFNVTIPSGYSALNTQNLTTPTITNGAQYMAAATYTGTGSTQTIYPGASGVSYGNNPNNTTFQPDLVWVKGRSASTQDHTLVDAVRGVYKRIRSNTSAAEVTETNFNVTAFNNNGFSVADDTAGSYNVNGSVGGTYSGAALYVGWQWKGGNGTVSNTSGSITSTVSANTSAGFSVVTWAGNSTSGATIGHGLGVSPSMIITKGRTNPTSWVVGIGGISGFGVNDYLTMNTTNAKASSSTFYQAYGSSTFTVGVSAADEMNKTGNNYVSYVLAPIAGYSAFGSYTGNGSTDGAFIYLGFRPRWLLIKRTDTTDNWRLFDSTRAAYNDQSNVLYPNLSNVEDASTGIHDFLSNGFKNRSATADNASGGTYVYAAFAENPFKISRAR